MLKVSSALSKSEISFIICFNWICLCFYVLGSINAIWSVKLNRNFLEI